MNPEINEILRKYTLLSFDRYGDLIEIPDYDRLVKTLFYLVDELQDNQNILLKNLEYLSDRIKELEHVSTKDAQ